MLDDADEKARELEMADGSAGERHVPVVGWVERTPGSRSALLPLEHLVTDLDLRAGPDARRA